MGTIHRLPIAGGVTLADAVGKYLDSLAGEERRKTRAVYARTLARVVDAIGPSSVLDEIDPDEFDAWFVSVFESRSPSTWNGALAAFRSAAGYWAEQGWASADPSRQLRRRKVSPDRDRALSRAQLGKLLRDKCYPLRDRLLWRMLYETAARSAEVLRLDVPDLDMANRRTRVTRKGGAADVIVWQTETAVLLPRYLGGRSAGPLFLTERAARSDLGLNPADVDPATGRGRLSYQQAEAIFKEASGGATLHQLRHSALTHAAETGTNTPMLMAMSGHTSIRSLGKYARPSADALAQHRAASDPARRR